MLESFHQIISKQLSQSTQNQPCLPKEKLSIFPRKDILSSFCASCFCSFFLSPACIDFPHAGSELSFSLLEDPLLPGGQKLSFNIATFLMIFLTSFEYAHRLGKIQGATQKKCAEIVPRWKVVHQDVKKGRKCFETNKKKHGKNFSPLLFSSYKILILIYLIAGALHSTLGAEDSPKIGCEVFPPSQP